MTLIENDSPKVQYTGPFIKGQLLPLTFPYIATEDVKMIIDDKPAIFNVDYEIITEPNDEHPVAYPNSAYIKSDLPNAKQITLYRVTPLDQQAPFPQQSKFRSERVEQALDKLTMQQQEQEEQLSRCIIAPITLETFNGQLPAPAADQALKWNTDGTELENYDIIGEQEAFETDINTRFEEQSTSINTQFSEFRNEINENLEAVLNAAEKLEELDAAVQNTENAAERANQSALSAQNSAQSAQEAIAIIDTKSSETIEDINDIKTDAITNVELVADMGKQEIQDLVDEIKDNAETIINRVGLNMFDPVVKDHILTYEESRGLALQGTYVYKNAIAGERYGYPNFYNKCLEEYSEATKSETVNAVTLKVHDNGHKFYDIANKEAIDSSFNTLGMAWYYGIDEENERIFLPRNVWFEQMSMDDVGKAIEAGLPTHTHTRGTMNITGQTDGGYSGWSASGAFYNTGKTHDNFGGGASGFNIQNFDASRSWTGSTSTGNYSKALATTDTVQPNAVKKLLYICVGNTVSDTSWVDVVTQVQEGAKDIQEAKDEAIEAMRNVAGGTVPIGFIGSAILGIDETLNLQRYLNGQIIIQDQFKGFTKFLKRRIELYPSLACTEDEWQTTVTMSAFSQCGKFVIDDNAGTIRLPKVVNIQGLTDLSKLGEIVEAGLPTHTHTRGTMNITGQVTETLFGTSNVVSTGALSAGSVSGTPGTGGHGTKARSIAFNASKAWTGSTSTGNYSKALATTDTVQQEQIQYPYFIQVATGAETEDNIINEIELNNPFSLLDYKYSEYELNNLSWLRSNGQYNSKAVYPAVYDLLLKIYNGTETKAGVSVKLSTETFTDYDFVVNPADETFRLPVKVKQKFYNAVSGNFPVVGDGKTLGLSDGTGTVALGYVGGDLKQLRLYSEGVGASIGTSVSTIVGNDKKSYGVTTDSSKSGMVAKLSSTEVSGLYLYFYVGETVQNANLINAGRIEEVVSQIKADKLDKSAVKAYIVESYVNGTSWYNLYSNGWIEQGGRIVINSATVGGGTYNNTTLTFIKPFSKLMSWHCQARHDRFNAGFNANVGGAVSSVDVYQVNDATGSFSNAFVLWEAKGYIA